MPSFVTNVLYSEIWRAAENRHYFYFTFIG